MDILSRDFVTRKNILDKGYVEIVDVSPRIVPEGRTPEFRIVEAARTSFLGKLRSIKVDKKLIRYLMINRHTSPFEMCSVTMKIKVPKAIAIQLIRHRTMKVNEQSQRYSKVEENDNYNPLDVEGGVRLQSSLNIQGSKVAESKDDDDKLTSIRESMLKCNRLQQEIFEEYSKMIDYGCAKEIARFWLPMNQYTTLVVNFDLNNLFKMLSLRADHHAQWEIQEMARAMIELVQPLFPTCFEVFEEQINGVSFTKSQVEAIKLGFKLEVDSVSEKNDFNEKKRKLGID